MEGYSCEPQGGPHETPWVLFRPPQISQNSTKFHKIPRNSKNSRHSKAPPCDFRNSVKLQMNFTVSCAKGCNVKRNQMKSLQTLILKTPIEFHLNRCWQSQTSYEFCLASLAKGCRTRET